MAPKWTVFMLMFGFLAICDCQDRGSCGPDFSKELSTGESGNIMEQAQRAVIQKPVGSLVCSIRKRTFKVQKTFSCSCDNPECVVTCSGSVTTNYCYGACTSYTFTHPHNNYTREHCPCCKARAYASSNYAVVPMTCTFLDFTFPHNVIHYFQKITRCGCSTWDDTL